MNIFNFQLNALVLQLIFVKLQITNYVKRNFIHFRKAWFTKLISNSSNAIIVESLIDGKRFPAYSNSKIIALEDISIYTEAEDMPLKEVFKRISAKENGKSALSHKEPTEKILAYFEEIVPEYDKERVYVSDMKKIIQWYNLLTEKGMLDLDEEAKEEEKKEA